VKWSSIITLKGWSFLYAFLKDVDGFLETRVSPLVIEAEAKQLLLNQKELGFTFVQSDDIPVDRMVIMENRDKGKLTVGQESNGLQ
jgi:hypothetical protein